MGKLQNLSSKTKIILVAVLSVLVVAALTLGIVFGVKDCSTQATWQVTFMDGDTQVSVYNVERGKNIPDEDIPTLNQYGKNFIGWAEDDAEELFTSSTIVEKDMVLYAWFELENSTTSSSTGFYDAGFVTADHEVVLMSEEVITAENLGNYLTVNSYGAADPVFTVESLGGNRYGVKGNYEARQRYRLELTAEGVTFEEQEGAVTYDFSVSLVDENGEVQEIVKSQKVEDIIDISAADFIGIEEYAEGGVYGTDGEELNACKVAVYATDGQYKEGDVIGVPSEDGGTVYYKVYEVLAPASGDIYELIVVDCDISDVYEGDVDIYVEDTKNYEEIEIEDIDTSELEAELKQSENLAIYTDYITSAVNDTATFKKMATAAFGSPVRISYTSATLLAAESTYEDAWEAVLSGIDAAGGWKPGVEVSITPNIDIRQDQYNAYWAERNKKLSEKNRLSDFDSNFIKATVSIGISVALTGGNTNLTISAELSFTQYIQVRTSISGEITIYLNPSKTYRDLEVIYGSTVYTESIVGLTVKLSTGKNTVDVTEEIDALLQSDSDEAFSEENPYITRFRTLYDGGSDYIDIWQRDILNITIPVAIVTIKIPIKLVLRAGLSAGVGVDFCYRNIYDFGIKKIKGTTEIKSWFNVMDADYELDVYIAGHLGLQLALNIYPTIGFVGLNEWCNIGVEIETGLQADLYGYYLLKLTKPWYYASAWTQQETGAYYFYMGLYLEIDVTANVFVYDYSKNIYQWNKELLSAGDRYVPLSMTVNEEAMAEENLGDVTISVHEDLVESYTLEAGKYDGVYYTFSRTIDTVVLDLRPFVESLKFTWFDLVTVKEVSDSKITAECVEQALSRISVSTTGVLAYNENDGKLYIDPTYVKNLLNGVMDDRTETLTLEFVGSAFSFGSNPAVTFNISVELLTGNETHTATLMVGDDENGWQVYKEVELLEGATLASVIDTNVDSDWCAENGYAYAYFSLPKPSFKRMREDITLYATVGYPKYEVVYDVSRITDGGIINCRFTFKDGRYGDDPKELAEIVGVNYLEYYKLGDTFLGWQLIADETEDSGSETTSGDIVLNETIPFQLDKKVRYKAVYGDLPKTTVTINTYYGEHVDGDTPDDTHTITTVLGKVVNMYYYYSYNAYSADCDIVSGTVVGDESYFYPVTTEVTVELTLTEKVYTAKFYKNNADGTSVLYNTQSVYGVQKAADPLVEGESYSDFDYYSADGYYMQFVGWARTYRDDYLIYYQYDTVTEDVVYFAQYKKLGRYYKVTLLDESGEVITTDQGVTWNEKWVEEETNLYHVYTFGDDYSDQTGQYMGDFYWKCLTDETVTDAVITADATYRKAWNKVELSYAIKLVVEDGVTAVTDSGEEAVFPDFGDETYLYSEIKNVVDEALAGIKIVKESSATIDYEYSGYYLEPRDRSLAGRYMNIVFSFAEESKKIAVNYTVNDSCGAWIRDEDGNSVAYGETGGVVYEYTHRLTDGTVFFPEYTAQVNDEDRKFVGWSYNGTTYKTSEGIDLSKVNGEVTLTAVFENKPYLITLDLNGADYDGATTFYRESGEQLELPSALSKEEDTQYTYTFDGWTDEDGNACAAEYTVTGAATLTAKFTVAVRSYTITFAAGGGNFSDGTTEQSETIEYGAMPTIDEPVRAADDDYSYTFNGWSPEISAVSGEATYTARWKQTALVVLTFNANGGVFKDGETTKTYKVANGDTFNFDEVDAPYYYVDGKIKLFAGYADLPEGTVQVTENATYTAEWGAEITEIGIKISDGKTSEDVLMGVGSGASVSGYELSYDAEYEKFSLYIVSSGLTLSGSGSIDYISGTNVDLTLDGLTLNGAITLEGTCTLTIKNDVTINVSASAGEAIRGDESATETSTPANLTIVGSGTHKLTINATETGGIVVYGGTLTLSSLTATLTATEQYDSDNAVYERTALGASDSVNTKMTITNCTVTVTRGMLSGAMEVSGSTITFTSYLHTGICLNYDGENLTETAQVVLKNSSKIIFTDKVVGYINVCSYDENGTTLKHITVGVDESDNFTPYDSVAAFTAALTEAGIDWIISIDTTSAIEMAAF